MELGKGGEIKFGHADNDDGNGVLGRWPINYLGLIKRATTLVRSCGQNWTEREDELKARRMFKLRKEHLALLSHMNHLTHWRSLQIKKIICSELKQNMGNGTATE